MFSPNISTRKRKPWDRCDFMWIVAWVKPTPPSVISAVPLPSSSWSVTLIAVMILSLVLNENGNVKSSVTTRKNENDCLRKLLWIKMSFGPAVPNVVDVHAANPTKASTTTQISTLISAELLSTRDQRQLSTNNEPYQSMSTISDAKVLSTVTLDAVYLIKFSFIQITLRHSREVSFSPVNFQNEVESLASLRLEVDRGVVVANATAVNLSVSLALWQLIDDPDGCDCSVVALIGERESHVLGDDSPHRWWLSADAVMDQIIVRTDEAPSGVGASSETSQGQQRETECEFHFN